MDVIMYRILLFHDKLSRFSQIRESERCGGPVKRGGGKLKREGVALGFVTHVFSPLAGTRVLGHMESTLHYVVNTQRVSSLS